MGEQLMSVEDRLESIGLSLPDLPKPSGHYLGAVQAESFLYVSGVTCKWNGTLPYRGRVGEDLSLEEGYEAARLTTLNQLAIVKETIGSLRLIERVVKVTGYVSCAPGFPDVPKVINGSSDLLVELFGDSGKHARCAVGVSSLPGNAAVETDLLVLLKKG
ncbi:RidA family protein [Rossellomorea aquimaris]|uniref:RidA family protein n=1 Tax=Rossellomorea aquimaris TaxID=189382 RepID=UPI001CD42E2D|nr:RidA family protein [Rossellomorea aquimaris]MCA1055220.1 RidA family protein [Rossellomorea aquimaris]